MASALESPLLGPTPRLPAVTAVDSEPPRATGPGYRLHSFEDFRRYIIEADVKLVRPQYLRDLHRQGRVWPRRQEAEDEAGALYAPGAGDEFRVVTISHAWESMEHPDPCGFQLAQIVGRMDVETRLQIKSNININFAKSLDVYFFIDFLSLYQYKRKDRGQEEAFRSALYSMHLFYANSHEDFCHVWRIESLTPRSMWWWQMLSGKVVRIYYEPVGCMMDVPLKELKRNRTPYHQRGWCRSEVEWSKPFSTDISRIQDQVVRRCVCCWKCLLFVVSSAVQAYGELPLLPDEFRESVESLAFTHRADLGRVVELQRRVFEEKLEAKSVVLTNPHPAESYRLLELLPLHSNLQRFDLSWTFLAPGLSQELLRLLASQATLRDMRFDAVQLADGAATVLADGMRRGEPPLQRLTLDGCLSAASVVRLAEGLAANSTIKTLSLMGSSVQDRGAVALAEALRTNRTLETLNLRFGGIGSAGALALAAGLEDNDTLEMLRLSFNPIGPRGLRALGASRRREGLTIRHESLKVVGGPISSCGCAARHCCLWCSYACVVVVSNLTRIFMYGPLLAFRLLAWLRWLCFRIKCWCRSGCGPKP